MGKQTHTLVSLFVVQDDRLIIRLICKFPLISFLKHGWETKPKCSRFFSIRSGVENLEKNLFTIKTPSLNIECKPTRSVQCRTSIHRNINTLRQRGFTLWKINDHSIWKLLLVLTISINRHVSDILSPVFISFSSVFHDKNQFFF